MLDKIKKGEFLESLQKKSPLFNDPAGKSC